MPRRVSRCWPFVALGVFLLIRRAYGYVDPGTGSYVLQTLLGLFVALAFTLKIYWQHVAGFFRSRFSRKRRDEMPKE